MAEELRGVELSQGDVVAQRIDFILNSQKGEEGYYKNPEQDGNRGEEYAYLGGVVARARLTDGYFDKSKNCMVYAAECRTLSVLVCEPPDYYGEGDRDVYVCEVKKSLEDGAGWGKPEYRIERRTGTQAKNIIGRPKIRHGERQIDFTDRIIPTDEKTYNFHLSRVLSDLAEAGKTQTQRANTILSVVAPSQTA